MIHIDHDRRRAERVSLDRPCKVYEPRSRKYHGGRTCNVTPGGMLLRVDRPLELDVGDRLYVGVAQKRRHALLRSDEMVEAEVVRALPITSGETAVAVHFLVPPCDAVLPHRRAA